MSEQKWLEYDPNCYLCPGNARAGGVNNPQYASTFVFENDFAALRPQTTVRNYEGQGILLAEAEAGICRGIFFSPPHDLAISTKPIVDGIKGVKPLVEQYNELGSLPFINSVQIF